VSHVNPSSLTTSLAVPYDVLSFGDDDVGLWVFASSAQDEFVNKAVQELTKPRGIVCAIDDVAITLFVKGGLRTQFTAKELGRVWVKMSGGKGLEGEDVQVGGRLKARAISDIFGMTVLIPFPFPSIFVCKSGILRPGKRESDAGGMVAPVSVKFVLEDVDEKTGRRIMRIGTYIDIATNVNDSSCGHGCKMCELGLEDVRAENDCVGGIYRTKVRISLIDEIRRVC
jgi:hypothetical protein